MIAVTGLGLWAPGFDGLAAWQAGAPDDGVTLPRCDVADARAKRGTSRLARMLGEVIVQAARAARVDLASTPTVYSSAWGEIDVMVGLLEQIADGEAGLSPLRFKHSVHNAAAGLVSIATGNTGFSTSVAAGRNSFELGLLEAIGHLEAGASERVLYAIAEDRLPDPLAFASDHDALAVGLCLETIDAAGPRALAHLDLVRGDVASDPDERGDTLAALGVPASLRENPSAWALPLVDAVGAGRRLRYRASPRAGALAVSLTPALEERT